MKITGRNIVAIKTYIDKKTGEKRVDSRGKSNIIKEHGRKFMALLITLTLLLVGMVIKYLLKIEGNDYEIFAKYAVVALGVFSAGNTVNFGAAILKDIKNGGKKE